MDFMFSWQEQYLARLLRSLVRYCSCHSNIKFISSRRRVISSIYKGPLDQSDCWKLFVKLWNYTNCIYKSHHLPFYIRHLVFRNTIQTNCARCIILELLSWVKLFGIIWKKITTLSRCTDLIPKRKEMLVSTKHCGPVI